MSPTATGDTPDTTNPLRPQTIDEIVGQPVAKRLMTRAIDSCLNRIQALPHTLFVGASGTGKTTFAHVLGTALGVDVFEVEAPVSTEFLLSLRTTMPHGAILKIDEIHQQAIAERRGKSSSTQPEILYSIMEDRTMVYQGEILPFPHITVVGTTTDEGALPDAFVNRFPLKPRFVAYTDAEMARIVGWNAQVLQVQMDGAAITALARACRGVPREANNLVKNAAMLFPPTAQIGYAEALEVLDIIGVTPDGLTGDMQDMLTFMFTKGRDERAGEVRYQSSINSIATGIGKSRDTKAVALRVEPFLILQGLVQVHAGSGRRLTDAGVKRARELAA